MLDPDTEISGDVKPLLQSCVALGSSLLETYLPDGNRRPSRDSQEDFKRKVETFFREASCSKYGSKLFDQYREGDRNNNDENIFTRRGNGGGSEVIFHKIDPTANIQPTIIKTKAGEGNDNPNIPRRVIDIASDIVNQEKAKEGAEVGSNSEAESKEFPF